MERMKKVFKKEKLLKFKLDSFAALCTKNRESIPNIKLLNSTSSSYFLYFFFLHFLSSCSSLQSLYMIVMWRWNNSLIMNFILIFLLVPFLKEPLYNASMDIGNWFLLRIKKKLFGLKIIIAWSRLFRRIFISLYLSANVTDSSY